ncbi:MAG: hypothetical protein HZA54_06300, partial [Planctomycetes bacterium]|nr:hypothetical protein [Planctomycetota bacterium]
TLLAAGAAVAWARRRRAHALTARPLSPSERALRELDALLARGPAALDLTGFYVELTAIVRRYIERTRGVRAPEQTTEEFLREIGRHEAFAADERERLQRFLESADLVKFAALRPVPGDVAESLRRARLCVGLAAVATGAAPAPSPAPSPAPAPAAAAPNPAEARP